MDLGGFQISCRTPVGSCNGNGNGRGVSTDFDTTRGTSVKNGSIVGMGSEGVRVGPRSEVMTVRVRENGGDGIRTNEGATVQGNTVTDNGGYGLSVGARSAYRNNNSSHNGTR